jgi:2-polyprenyl-3-methyl-5-hydroxy-6-metoxy-1,4-benzoquinol methylase
VTARDFLVAVSAGITRDYPMVANGLLPNQLAPDDPLWEWAELGAAHVLRITRGDERRIADCADAFVATSIDFLRLQARFMKTGTYAKTSASETAALYADSETMTDYLDGLALTYAMWPNHARMLEFFVRAFVPTVPESGRVLEVGPGHGLFASVLLDARADVDYVGVDISPRSISYSADAFAATGIATDRYELVVGDATDAAVTGGRRAFDAAICCEVLEHVDVPAALLTSLRGRIDTDRTAFVSTVANMEAEDHVYLFHDADDIRATLRGAGFTVVADQPLPLPNSASMVPAPLNYSAIIRS